MIVESSHTRGTVITIVVMSLVVVLVVTMSWGTVAVTSGHRAVVSTLDVVVVQVSWGIWRIFCGGRGRSPKLANSSSTDNRKHSNNAIAMVHRAGYSTLPRPPVVAISGVEAARIGASTATIVVTVAVTDAVARG